MNFSKITPTEVAASTGVLASYLVLYSSYSKITKTLKPELLMKMNAAGWFQLYPPPQSPNEPE